MRTTAPSSADCATAGTTSARTTMSGTSGRTRDRTRPRCHAGGGAVNFSRQSVVDADERVADRVDLTADVRLRAPVALPPLDRRRVVGAPSSLAHAAVDDYAYVGLGLELLREVCEQLGLPTRHDEEVRDHRYRF